MALTIKSERRKPVTNTEPESYDPKVDKPLPQASAFDAPEQDPLARAWDAYRQWINSKYQGTGFEDPSLKQTGDAVRTPSLRDVLSGTISGVAETTGADPRTAQWIAGKTAPATEFLPGVGTAASADASKAAYDRGDYGEAAMEGLGGIPFGGHLLSAGAHALAPAAKAMLIGPMSKMFNQDMAKLAEEMWTAGKAAGQSEPELLNDIWSMTGTDVSAGTTRSAGGHWKQEIPDVGSNFQHQSNYADDPVWKAGKVFEHPKGYEAYPELADTEFAWNTFGGRDNVHGEFRGMDETGDPRQVTINPHGPDPRSTMLHENFSHGVQDIEGWEKGGNTNVLRPGTPAWDIYQKRLEAINTPMSREAFYAEGGPAHPGIYDYEDYLKETKAAARSPAMRGLLDRSAQDSAVEEAYQRNAAEAEARNVQTRKDMPLEELKAKPFHSTFDVPLDQQIVRQRDKLADVMQSKSFDPKIDPVTGQPMFGVVNRKPGFTGYSGVKMREPLADLKQQIDQRPSTTQNLLPDKIIQPTDLPLGGRIVATPSDRTGAGMGLFGLGGVPFPKPVELIGGGGYMRGAAQQKSGSLWANAQSEMEKINKYHIGDNPDQPTFLMPVAMGEQAGDFSHMMDEVVRAQMANVPPEQRAALDAFIGSRGNVPGWPGFDAYLKGDWRTSGTNRSKLMEELDSSAAAKLGAPNMALARLGITDPALADVPTLSSGFAIGKVDPDFANRVFKAEPEHPSYPAGIKGTNVGRFEFPLPLDVGYQDFWRDRITKLLSKGKTKEDLPHTQRALTMAGASQEVTPEWQDRASHWLEKRKEQGD